MRTRMSRLKNSSSNSRGCRTTTTTTTNVLLQLCRRCYYPYGLLLLLFGLGMISVSEVSAGNATEWKRRAIYQMVTDRFARDSDHFFSSNTSYKYNKATEGACGDLSQYCGGTFKGMKNNLDYIQVIWVFLYIWWKISSDKQLEEKPVAFFF